MTPNPLSKDIIALAGGFAASGVVHLVKPDLYEPLMPKAVPAHRAVILGSGVAELICAAGLLHPRTRRLAGWASVALLAGVFPANLKMANDARGSSRNGRRIAAVGRLPLQLPMIRIALKAARSA